MKTVVLVTILFSALSRIVPHPWNLTAITAVALFAGANLPRWWAAIIPTVALAITDVYLGWHESLIAVYGVTLFLSLVLAPYLKNHSRWNLIWMVPVSSGIFFLVTNLSVWAFTELYPHTPTGLWECYVMAIPFLVNTFLGDSFYSGILFGGQFLAESVKAPSGVYNPCNEPSFSTIRK